MTRQANCPERAFTIRSVGEGPRVIAAKGCDRWALESLIATGSKACTPLLNPAPWWSAYVHKLRKAHMAIAITTENHRGPFVGHNASYMLTCNVAAGWKGRAA